MIRFLVITDELLVRLEPTMREKILAATYYTDYVNRARFIRDDSNLASWLMLKYDDIKSVDAVFTLEP